MHSNSILTTNLLDIIFENRNKDYGAYILRKNYNKRLLKSLAITLGLVVVFILLMMIVRKNATSISTILDPVIPPTTVSALKVIEPQKHFQSQVKHDKAVIQRPLIIKIIPVDEPKQETLQISASSVGQSTEPAFDKPDGGGINSVPGETREPEKSAVMIDRAVPVLSPEILPQFPGGINELMKFLRRNLNTPEQLEDEQEIGVRVKFVVSYTGDLMGFDVIETGGAPFDNEVIRVLKKMPKWIPGKTNGENVSTYFIIPVKFRVSD
jgi:protein TonB